MGLYYNKNDSRLIFFKWMDMQSIYKSFKNTWTFFYSFYFKILKKKNYTWFGSLFIYFIFVKIQLRWRHLIHTLSLAITLIISMNHNFFGHNQTS